MDKDLKPSVISKKTMLILGTISGVLLLVNTILTILTYTEIVTYDKVTAIVYSYDYDNDVVDVEYTYQGNYYIDTIFIPNEGAYEYHGYVNPDDPSNFVYMSDIIVGTIIIYGFILIYVLISSVFIFKALFNYYLPKRLKQFGDRKLAKITYIDSVKPGFLIIKATRDGKNYKSITLKGDSYYWKKHINEYTYDVPIYFFKNKYYMDFEDLKPSIDNF